MGYGLSRSHIFFVISGFLVRRLLLKEHTRTSRIDLRGFYRRRAVRILPAALFYILVILLSAKVTVNRSCIRFDIHHDVFFFGQACQPLSGYGR